MWCFPFYELASALMRCLVGELTWEGMGGIWLQTNIFVSAAKVFGFLESKSFWGA
jgi:hypothetical protein